MGVDARDWGTEGYGGGREKGWSKKFYKEGKLEK